MKITTFTTRTVVVPVDNIDTDQIIPARFLKSTSREGMGDALFYDWRHQADGSPNEGFVLNTPEAAGAGVLVAGANFGCGSSREHATWALRQFGFQAIVSTSFGDIFRNNALKNALLPIQVDAEMHRMLLNAPFSVVMVDLVRRTLRARDREVVFAIDDFARHCLIEGVDELGYILSHSAAIASFERAQQGAGVTTKGG